MHPAGSFRPIRLSRIAADAMRNLETAAMRVEAASGAAETSDAYSQLNEMRERLATYVEQLELVARNAGAQGIEPVVSVRYR